MRLSRRAFGGGAVAGLAACAAGPRGRRVVAVAGATGGTGKFLIRDLTAAGFTVRALARDPDKARATIGGPYVWMKGDVREPATLAAAFDGADLSVSSIGATEATGPNSPEKVDWEGDRNTVDAAKTARLSRIVLISSANAGNPDSPLNTMFGNVLMWKGKAEDYLRASGLGYCIVRGPGLLDEPGGIKEIILEQTGGGRRTCTRADLATVSIAALSDPAAAGKTFVARNGEAAFRNNWAEQFAALKRD